MNSRTLLLCALLPASSAAAQCNYSHSILSQWDLAGAPAVGASQPMGAWTFWRSDLGRQPLVGVQGSGVPVGAWGAPDQSFFVPLLGARYSPSADRNQVPFYHRPPSFEGLLAHPGYSPIDLLCIFTPSGNSELTGLTLRAEHLGQISPNAVVSAVLESGGPTITLVPPTSIAALAPAQTLTATGLPLPMTVASRVVVRVNNGGSPFEDWVNLDASVSLIGPPVAVVPPVDTTACPGSVATLSVLPASGATFTWRRGGVPLSNGPTPWGSVVAGADTPVLSISGVSDADEALYDVVLTNACGPGATAAGFLTVLACCPDFNEDGNVDQDDVGYLITVVAGGENPTNRDPDFNRDGNVDQDDVLALVDVVAGGPCP
ncbi:MAG: hypothetical protein DYG92_04350 [Leptolyngbya sp. PLA1]|nr:hypothetical protein [Leptolyngbya sp. PLA1]